jgi:hypothetical protein
MDCFHSTHTAGGFEMQGLIARKPGRMQGNRGGCKESLVMPAQKNGLGCLSQAAMLERI